MRIVLMTLSPKEKNFASEGLSRIWLGETWNVEVVLAFLDGSLNEHSDGCTISTAFETV